MATLADNSKVTIRFISAPLTSRLMDQNAWGSGCPIIFYSSMYYYNVLLPSRFKFLIVCFALRRRLINKMGCCLRSRDCIQEIARKSRKMKPRKYLGAEKPNKNFETERDTSFALVA